ncbi:MAG TPA: glutamyl-tRNA reductase, partial [Patescibacteria group bacterium]|nr:glutamyl-tRNA reductase [Patescibacteria group bacterium]
MKLFVAGLSYKTAPVAIREKLAVQASRLRCHGCRLKLRGNLAEVVVVSTCNRVEIYGVAPVVQGRAEALFQELSNSQMDFTPYLYVKEGAEAVEHLFSVISGLDSMVIGETEITGQVKQAYQAAQEARLTGRVTNRLFQTALQVAKEIRTQTGIGRGSTSVGSVAVEL